jgi:hypothetical protein
MQDTIRTSRLACVVLKIARHHPIEEMKYSDEIGLAGSVPSDEYVQRSQSQSLIADGFEILNLELF